MYENLYTSDGAGSGRSKIALECPKTVLKLRKKQILFCLKIEKICFCFPRCMSLATRGSCSEKGDSTSLFRDGILCILIQRWESVRLYPEMGDSTSLFRDGRFYILVQRWSDAPDPHRIKKKTLRYHLGKWAGTGNPGQQAGRIWARQV